MKLKIYQIDAFSDHVFGGNPAAVVPLTDWPADSLMQSIAAENNLAETAFILPQDSGSGEGHYHIRWFTPTVEVDLCGHATLAAAWVIGNELEKETNTSHLRFQSRSGELIVTGKADTWTLDFPAYELTEKPEMVATLSEALKTEILAVYEAADLIAILPDCDAVASCQPDLSKIKALHTRGAVITAPGEKDTDFVSRFFAPAYGIDEDPVTGSAHCELMPYWSKKLETSVLKAKQVSPRGGEIACEISGKRVRLTGQAVKYLEGEIWVQHQSAG